MSWQFSQYYIQRRLFLLPLLLSHSIIYLKDTAKNRHLNKGSLPEIGILVFKDMCGCAFNKEKALLGVFSSSPNIVRNIANFR